MGRFVWTVVTYLILVSRAAAATTWPSPVDELEDIMYLNTGYRARGFAAPVTPCSFSSDGAGRVAAAEYIRTAFHDMATGNTFFGTGGLDASIIFELGGNQGDNIGPAFPSTLTKQAPFFSSRSSMADIIALGLYAAVRSCSGPAVPFKSGRVDATEAGPVGVPLPQNSLFTFQNQFARVGFNATEMIQVVACGHTLGGVHASNFPQIVPPGSAPDDVVHFDSTTKFDEKIASEFVSGSTKDPLTVGPSKSVGRDSDYRVFSSDGNVTISAMANPTTYTTTCKALLQRMIEVVPSGVALTDPIVPYEIKPNALQLTLLSGGSIIQFAGEIRVRTTSRPASQIASVDIIYKDRNGGSGCGACKISTSVKGNAAGFDDSFTFYGFSWPLSSATSISSFNVIVTLTSGTKQIYGNGAGFPVQDQIMLQSPQSCLASNALKVVAAVRSTSGGTPSLDLTLKVARTGIIVPALQAQSVAMTKGSTVGPYTLYSATYTLDASQTQNTKFDVTLTSGTVKVADSFKNAGDLGATCTTLIGSLPSSTITTTTKSTSSSTTKSTSSSTTKSTSSSSSSSTSTTTKSSSSSTTTKSSTSSTTTSKT